MRLPTRVDLVLLPCAVLLAFTPLRPTISGRALTGAECTTCCPDTGSRCIVCASTCVEVPNAYDNGPGKCPPVQT